MKKVALIQSKIFFTPELKAEYLGNIPLLTSTDIIEIYKFIKKNIIKNHIYKYILHVNSGVLSNFIDYIYEKKKKSLLTRKLFCKSIFIATFSNANSVREKNIIKNTKIYFSLSPISTVLQVLNGIPPNRLMLVVSDTNNPYYNQIYDSNIIPKYRILELTVDKINDFAKTGSNITIALDTKEEYEKLTNLILQSNFTRQLTVIEIDFINLIESLKKKLSSITASSSGVCTVGDIKYYNKLNQYLLYENCVVILANFYNIWEHLIANKLITIDSPNYNTSIVFDI